LLKIARIHEVVAQVVFVKELVCSLFNAGGGYFFTGVEGFVEGFSGAQTLHFGSHEGGSFTWLYVLKIDNRKDVVVYF
jgi:hypothetical protein